MTARRPGFQERAGDFNGFHDDGGPDGGDGWVGVVDEVPTFGNLLGFVGEVDAVTRVSSGFCHAVGGDDEGFAAFKVAGEFDGAVLSMECIEMAEEFPTFTPCSNPHAVDEVFFVGGVTAFGREADAVESGSFAGDCLKLAECDGDFDVGIEEEQKIFVFELALEAVVRVGGPRFLGLVIEGEPVGFCFWFCLANTGGLECSVCCGHVLLNVNG
ncbi:MAG: hypothetical protein RIS92_1113 [Verrucomicrobiota bacterium]